MNSFQTFRNPFCSFDSPEIAIFYSSKKMKCDRSHFLWSRSHRCDRSRLTWCRSQVFPFSSEPAHLRPIAYAIDRKATETSRKECLGTSEPSSCNRNHLGEIGRKSFGIGRKALRSVAGQFHRDRNQRLGIGTRSLRSVPDPWDRYQLSGIGTRGWKSKKNDFKLQNSTFWSPTLL